MTVSLLVPISGQPQIVTFTLDCLLQMNETIDEVYVLHLSPSDPRIANALRCLHDEFVEDRYGGRPCRLRRMPLKGATWPLLDIRTAADAEIAFHTARDLIAELKQQDRRLHLCLAGGRRMLGLMLMSAAMLLCDHQDRLWHLYTPDPLRAQAAGGSVMHASSASGVRLVPVPIAPWGAYFPGLRALALPPQEAVAAQMGLLSAEEEQRCRIVIEHLTPRQQTTLRRFANGLRPQAVAEDLKVTLSTVNAHKTVIFAECRTAWELDDSQRLDFHFLTQHFAQFFRRHQIL